MAKLERTDKPVSVLLEELKRGELSLPEIQRGYVWHKPQARDLVDSLYREYPSGLILLWKPERLPELRDPELEHFPGNKTPAYLILDGQQRLTSLAKVIDPNDKDMDLYFNVETEEFQLFSSNLKANPLWVSVKEVLNNGAVKVWRELKNNLSSGPIVGDEKLDEYLERLSRVEKIKEYRYPVMIIHTDDYEEVTESFIRVNFKGTRLREAEMAMARLAFLWPGVLIKEFENALNDYEQVNFDFEPRFLMRCFIAIATGQSRFRYLSSLWKKSPDELKEIWKQTKSGIDYTINFLRNNAGIESVDWVPSLNALIPIVVYLSEKYTLSEQEEKSLLYWFFLATIYGRFTGSPESKLDQDLKAIKESDAINLLVNNLKREIPSFEITPDMLIGKYQRNPYLPLIFSIFRKNNAKDWFTGTILSSTNVGPSHQLEFHHIFPQVILKEAPMGYTPQEIDDIGNIAFLSQRANRKILNSVPKDYLKNIEDERLKAQFVPIDEELWEVNNFRKFLDVRRRLLTNAINSHLSSLGGRIFNES
jgi:hypothetical protein